MSTRVLAAVVAAVSLAGVPFAYGAAQSSSPVAATTAVAPRAFINPAADLDASVVTDLRGPDLRDLMTLPATGVPVDFGNYSDVCC